MKIGDYETHEYADLFPMMQGTELLELTEDIRTHGLNQPIVLYENKILDGRNRYVACREANVKPAFKEYEGSAPLEWVISGNLHRRHLSVSQRAALSIDLLPLLEEKAKQKRLSTLKQNATKLANLPKREPEFHSAKEAAKILNIGERYVREAKKIQETSPQAIKELKQGTKTLQEVKREQRFEKIKTQRAAIEQEALTPPTGEYDCIVIDPPWKYEGDSEAYNPEGNRGTVPYPTMTLEELKQIKLPSKKDSILWLWTTNLFMEHSFNLLRAWEYEPKTILTWDKQHFGTGRWLRSQTEHCILATKGKPFWDNTKHGTLISEKRTQHSKKPKAFYDLVEELCPGRKLDYFARQKREGWDVYGDEVR
jgi:N6-adenosine-specific RNA methylase IME4